MFNSLVALKELLSSNIGQTFLKYLQSVCCSSPHEECWLLWSCGIRLVYFGGGGLLSRSISRGSSLVLGDFSLVLLFELLSRYRVTKLSGYNFLVVAGDFVLVAMFTGLSSCGGGISLLGVVDSSVFVSETHINLLWGISATF